MRVILERKEKGYYQVDDNGLPRVTLFLSEAIADAHEDAPRLAVDIVMPGPNGEL